MRLPRMQFTLRRMMIAVALVGILLAVLVLPLTKPYPMEAGRSGPFVFWLVTSGQEGLTPLSTSEGVALVRVRWSDGTATWHLRRPSWLLPY